MKEQIIYHASCWGCKRAQEDPQEKYICPQTQQHLKDYKKYKEFILSKQK